MDTPNRRVLFGAPSVRAVAVAGLCAAAGLFIGCDKTPTAPGPATPPLVRSFEIVGPEVVPLNESVTFKLIAHMTDGSTRDVTTDARWFGGEDFASVSAPGVVAGRARGETGIGAEFERQFRTKQVVVLPAGTYRLVGSVVEDAVLSWPVVGARVEVTTGAGAGLSAVTDDKGMFRLYGVANQTGLRVTKDGYHHVTDTIVVSDRHTMHNIPLRLVASRADVSGQYLLTLTADRRCGSGLGDGRLPEDVRTRTYKVEVQQDGPRLMVTSRDGTFRGNFFGRVEPDGVVFDLDWYQEQLPSFVEQLSTSRFLVVDGRALVSRSANRLDGPLFATFRVFESNEFYSEPAASCISFNHHFALSREQI